MQRPLPLGEEEDNKHFGRRWGGAALTFDQGEGEVPLGVTETLQRIVGRCWEAAAELHRRGLLRQALLGRTTPFRLVVRPADRHAVECRRATSWALCALYDFCMR